MTIQVKERYENLKQSTLFEIETIMGKSPKWEIVRPSWIKKDGKFLIYHPDFIKYTQHESRVFGDDARFVFNDQEVASEFAKALAHVWDRPLRVIKVQRIRIQRTIGKIILPVGGM